jgi:hypothetical protein
MRAAQTLMRKPQKPEPFETSTIVSRVDDRKERIYHAGESFTENPHAYHVLFRNSSWTESTRIYAVFLGPEVRERPRHLGQTLTYPRNYAVTKGVPDESVL